MSTGRERVRQSAAQPDHPPLVGPSTGGDGVDGVGADGEAGSPFSQYDGISPGESASTYGGSRASSSKGKQRASSHPVANACVICRRAKVKCSGKHPACQRCLERGFECVYDVSQEGISKLRDLRQKLDVQGRDLESATYLLNVLRDASDEVAAEVLARLRLGQSDEEIQERLKDLIPAAMQTKVRDDEPAAHPHPSGSAATYDTQFASLAQLYDQNMAAAEAEETILDPTLRARKQGDGGSGQGTGAPGEPRQSHLSSRQP